MPRISAPTVREHREIVLERLIDSAEQILREKGPAALTAAEVTKAAGIARNSVYRYVHSVDGLTELVLQRYLPGWIGAVTDAMNGESDPEAKILVWCQANLEQAARSGHGWLMQLARATSVGRETRDAVAGAHRDVEDVLLTEWRRLDAVRAVVCCELTRSLVDAGFRCLDRGESLDDVGREVRLAVTALITGTPAPA